MKKIKGKGYHHYPTKSNFSAGIQLDSSKTNPQTTIAYTEKSKTQDMAKLLLELSRPFRTQPVKANQNKARQQNVGVCKPYRSRRRNTYRVLHSACRMSKQIYIFPCGRMPRKADISNKMSDRDRRTTKTYFIPPHVCHNKLLIFSVGPSAASMMAIQLVAKV